MSACKCPSGDCPGWERKAGLEPINSECPEHGDSRRQILKASAWAVPVIAVAIAAPAAAASTFDPIAVSCTPLTTKGQPMWAVTYSDGQYKTITNDQAMRLHHKLCKPKGKS